MVGYDGNNGRRKGSGCGWSWLLSHTDCLASMGFGMPQQIQSSESLCFQEWDVNLFH